MPITGMKTIQYDSVSQKYRVIDKTTAFALILAICTPGTEMCFYVNHSREIVHGKKLNDYIDFDEDKLKIRCGSDRQYRDRHDRVFRNLGEYHKHCSDVVYAPVPTELRKYIPSDIMVQNIRVLVQGRALKDCDELKDFVDQHKTIAFRETKGCFNTDDVVKHTNLWHYIRMRGMIFPIDEGFTFPCIMPSDPLSDVALIESLRKIRGETSKQFEEKGDRQIQDHITRQCNRAQDAKRANMKAKLDAELEAISRERERVGRELHNREVQAQRAYNDKVQDECTLAHKKREREFDTIKERIGDKGHKIRVVAKANDLKAEFEKFVHEQQLEAHFPV